MSFAVAESSTEETSTTTGANDAATTAVGNSAKSAATRDENANSANSSSGSSDAVEETTTTTPTTTFTNEKKKNDHNDDEKLNAAYEALEKMRQLNLEVTCSELGIHYDASRHADQCTACLLANGNKNTTRRRRHRFSRFSQPPTKSQRNNNDNNNDNNDKNNSNNDDAAPGRFSRLSKLVPHQRSNQSSAKAKAKTTKTQHPQCLICGSPACRKHSSRTFRQESSTNLTVCLDCEKLFDLDFVVDCLLETNTAARRARIQHLLDSYDRALVMLRFSRQFIEPTAASLEESTELQNKVGLGSSGVGLASGVLGIAAAATILTPAGPPLLIASLLFGGSATAVQTGTEVALTHWSEPTKLADRIIALNGVRLSILRIVAILRDAMLLDHIRSDQYNGKNSIYSSSTNERTATTTSSSSTADATTTNSSDTKKQLLNSTASRGTMLGSLTVGRFSMAGTEVAQTGTLAGRNARFFSRTGSNLMRTARLARFAGGALSAAIVVLEARSMKHTIQNLQNGNPCQKAETLRAIQQELLSSESDGGDSSIVETDTLDRECERYLQTMDARQRAMTEEEVSQLLVEQSEKAFAEAAAQQELWQQQQVVVVEEETETLSSSPWTGADGATAAGEQQPPPHHDDDDDDNDNITNEQPSDTDLQQEHSFSIILDGLVEEADGDDDEHHDSDMVTCSSHASNSTTLSLLARIELHKQKEAAVAHPSSTNVAGNTASAAAGGATTATTTTSTPLDQTGVATASTASSMASPGLEE